MTYNAKYKRDKSAGIPQVGQTVSWLGHEFKVLSVSNMEERHIDYTRGGGKYYELITANLVVETDKDIGDHCRNLLERGPAYVS